MISSARVFQQMFLKAYSLWFYSKSSSVQPYFKKYWRTLPLLEHLNIPRLSSPYYSHLISSHFEQKEHEHRKQNENTRTHIPKPAAKPYLFLSDLWLSN